MGGTSESSILIGFSILCPPFWGVPIYGNLSTSPKLSTQELHEGKVESLRHSVLQEGRSQGLPEHRSLSHDEITES